MPDEAKQESAVNVDDKIEELYGGEKPSAPQEEETPKPEGTETPPGEGAKKPEGEGEPSAEDKEILTKIAKIEEILGDDEEAINTYIKKLGFHEHPAWKRQRELLEKYKKGGEISDDDKSVIESVKKLTSTPEGIRLLMKHEGYTDEAINNRLRELGHTVPEGKEDDFGYVLRTLNVDVSKLTDDQKEYVNTYLADVVKVASLLIDKKFNNLIPEKLKPIQDNLKNLTRKEAASKNMTIMEGVVNKHGILDFEKDIVPLLDSFIEENPEASQEEVLAYFKEIYPDLLAERNKAGTRAKERQDKKEKGLRGQRTSTPTRVDLGNIKPVSGSTPNEVSKDIDRLMDELQIEWGK